MVNVSVQKCCVYVNCNFDVIAVTFRSCELTANIVFRDSVDGVGANISA